ncbi:MAG: MarR family transcriptional regulator [Pseudobacteriovorax sp.]|nr:MarR family transcriptional regulator [Pseudobacteriovorax sp.]
MQTANGHHWTFLTNHTHVLICLARYPDMLLKDVAHEVGITERAVQRIVAELVEAGFISRSKHGRCNHYELNLRQSLRHPVEKNCDVAGLIELIK